MSDFPVRIEGNLMLKQSVTQVKNEITKNGIWKGILVGNRVNHFHFFGGWYLACSKEFCDIDTFCQEKESFEFYLERELGTRAAFYKFIQKDGETL